MGRLIDADALKKEFPKDTDWEYPTNTNEYVCEKIDAQPTVRPETNCSEIPNNSDTISRQQAIDAVEKNACNTQRIMDAINNLPSAQPEQRWIPVTERLPDKFEDVWVTDNRGRVAVCHRGHSGWRDAESDDWMYFPDSVIAWMPLPEPYQEGEQG